jgi:hypothetical protein
VRATDERSFGVSRRRVLSLRDDRGRLPILRRRLAMGRRALRQGPHMRRRRRSRSREAALLRWPGCSHRYAPLSCFADGPARTSMCGRSPACASPLCSPGTGEIKGVALFRLTDSRPLRRPWRGKLPNTGCHPALGCGPLAIQYDAARYNRE